MAYQYETVHDLLGAYYGQSQVMKADAPVLTTTTGVFNNIYGAMAFSQLNMEANVFAVLPKYPWQHSGFRVITADAGSTGTGGISEGGAIPDTIKPTFAEVDVKPKEVAHSFDISYKQEGLVGKDDAFGKMAQLRPYFAALHAKRLNEMMLKDADTLASTNFESLDRITGTTASLVTALSYDAGDEDIYGIDRSSVSWADAYVDHNSGTDRTFQLSLIEDALASLEASGARTNVIITGADTKWRIISQAQASVRYQGVVKENEMIRVGINGVETEEGMNYGVRVATVYNIPLISSHAVEKDTISRIYLLDTTEHEGTGIPRLGISLLYPTLYFESGMAAARPDPFAINKFATEGVYYTSGELVCTFFAAQGSIRDLK